MKITKNNFLYFCEFNLGFNTLYLFQKLVYFNVKFLFEKDLI